jgi:diguanylate cyclase (GGDEF)-like protein
VPLGGRRGERSEAVTITPVPVPVPAPDLDAVTGARPRGDLQPRLTEELTRAARSGASCAVFLFDVDYFKTVNDVFGHLRGDEALRQLTDRIKSLVRPYDVLFRYGGDEFVLLLPDTGATEAARLALRLTGEVRDTPFPGEPPLHLSVSLGIATYPVDGTDGTALLECADRRNYLAKRRGRGGAVADDADVDAEPGSSRLWERDAALGAVHEFLTRLRVESRGALRVAGQPGAGHTRFLDEVTTIAALRGFAVVPVPPEPAPLPPRPERSAAGVLLLADVGDPARPAELAARFAAGPQPPPVLGLVYATTDQGGGAAEPAGLPVLGAVELTPWSPAALRIWLRTTLPGEPSRTLVSWLADRTGGLPAAATRELRRLRARDGLVRSDTGGWTLAPAVLGRPARRVRLPAQLTRLVGRAAETSRVVELLAGARLVTLAGPGGIGKTRLSLAAAAAAADGFDDGVAFVPLAETTSGARMVLALAHALGLGEIPGEPLLTTVVEHLAEASMLIVLDNFEQVLDAGPVVADLLAAAPDVSVLVTSREPLGLYGEQVYRVPPLRLPAAGAAGDSPAVTLFEQRARAANPDFALAADNLPLVAELCRRLDGLPLAIELAAARVDRHSPADLLARLTDHLDLPGAGPRDRPGRQQTLRGTLDWSYQLLDAAERRLFGALAAFTGGCTAEAAAAVAGPEPAGRLAALVDKSLLVADTEAGGETRYRMLETIRAYAGDRLAADPAAGDVHRRHAAYHAGFAELSAAGLTGPDQARWIERIEGEHANLRSAVEWALAHGDLRTAERICLGLWRFWRHGSHIGEGREWLARVLRDPPAEPAALPAAGETPVDVRARLLYAAAVLAATQDDHETAYGLGVRCLRLAEDAGDRETMAQAHNAMGAAAFGTGDLELCGRHLHAALALSEELEQPQGTAGALGNLAKLSLRLGDLPAASGYIDRCLRLERATGNTFGVVLGLEFRGQILLAQGDLAAARASLEDSLTLSRSIGDRYGEAMALHQLGLVAQREGNRQQAVTLLTIALLRRHEAGDREDLAVSLDSVGALALPTDPALAVRLLAAAEGLRGRHRLPTPPDVVAQRAPILAAARAALPGRAFAAAWTGGRNAPLDLVIDQALDLSPEA